MDICTVRKSVLGIFAVFGIVGSAFAAVPKPNIIVVIADDMSPYEIGCYGQKKIKTPNIDHLAQEGMRFTDCASGNPVCSPSRCTIITGLHCGHAQIRANWERGGFVPGAKEGQWALRNGTDTIARRLKKVGYTTGCFGKWGMGGPDTCGRPLNQGFDRFYGYNCQRHAHQYWPNHLWNDDTKEAVDNPIVPGHQNLPKGADPNDPKSYAKTRGRTYAPDLIIKETEKWLNEKVGKQPVFLFYATPLPHVPLVPPEKDMEVYRKQFPEKPYLGLKQQGYEPQIAPRAAYAAMVSRIDSDLGRIVKILKEKGEYENTLFIFTADNGTTFNGGSDRKFFDATRELRECKCSIYRGGVTVPFVVSWPGKIKAGQVCKTPIWLVDLYPTFCQIAGVEPAENLDGVSLNELFTKGKVPARDCFYWEHAGHQALRQGDYRWVRKFPRGKTELYNVVKDPGERNNLAKKEPALLKQGEAKMDAEHVQHPGFPLYPNEKRTLKAPPLEE